MNSVMLGVAGAVVWIAFYYLKVMSVLVDEKNNVEKHLESKARHRWLYWVSDKMESAWPFVKSIEVDRWANYLASIALLLVFGILIFAGLFKRFLTDHAIFFLVVIFVFMSISNGRNGVNLYKKIKPYLPVIFPAAMYQGLSMMEVQNPIAAQQLVIPGYDFLQTKLFAAFIGFFMAFLIPYPMALFDSWFSIFVAKGTLYFIRDFMRLGVKPDGDIEISLRKVAKESLAATLKLILTFIGFLTYLSYHS